jgi:adenylylsulfate kinase
VGSSTNIRWHEGSVSRQEKQGMLGQKAVVLWMTGLSGSGKSCLAYTVEHASGSGKSCVHTSYFQSDAEQNSRLSCNLA